MREILEAYYEPQFSNHSHGFRPNRGCHTALQEIQIWKGTRWFIEGDISKYFDTIDHDVLLKILEKNIHDGRFLRLISNMLKAGYLDDWKFNQTISGTPQGGVISPLLANIYLNEFDQWIENTLIPQYTKGKRQKSNPVYNRMNAEISKARKNGDMQTAHKLEVERRNIPSVDPYDENYRRCRYVRYADDFLIGFTGSKADAEEIKAAMHNFLENELHLELSQEKTLITNASSQAAKFLGYEIKAQRANDYIDPKGRRGANGAIALFVPAKVIESKCQSFKRKGKVTHRNELLQEDDFSIVQQFQAEYRGLIQYYILAQNLSWFSTLYWVMETSLLKTLPMPASITRYSSTGNLIALTSVAAMKSTAQSRCTTMVCAWVTVLLSRWWRNTVWSAPNMCWQRPFKSATAMGAFPAQTKNGQILCALSRTWTSVGLTGLAIMQVCKRTPVCWMALRIKCENLKRPKPNPPTVHPKDNRSVCILQALFFVKKSLFCERISL